MRLWLLALLIALVPGPSSAASRADWTAFLARHERDLSSRIHRAIAEAQVNLEVFFSSDGRLTLYRLAFRNESSPEEIVRWFSSGALNFDARDGGEAMHQLNGGAWPHFELGLRDPDSAWIRQAVNRTRNAVFGDLEGSYVSFGFRSTPLFEEVDLRNRTEFTTGPPLRRRNDGYREAAEWNLVLRAVSGRTLTLRIRSLRAEGLVHAFGPATHASRAARREYTGDFARELHRISEALLTESADSPRVRAIDEMEMRFADAGRDAHQAWRLLRLATTTNAANASTLGEVTPEMVHRIVNTNHLAFLIEFPDETVRPPLLITEEPTPRLSQVRVEGLAEAGATLGLEPGMSIHLRFASREPLEIRSTGRMAPLSWSRSGSAIDSEAASELWLAIGDIPLMRLPDGLIRVRGAMRFTAHSPSADPITQAMTELAAQVESVDRELGRLFEIVAIDRSSTVAPFNTLVDTLARTLRDLLGRGQPLTEDEHREIDLRAETLHARFAELRARWSHIESLIALIVETERWVERIELAIQNTETRHRPAGEAWRTLTEASRQQLDAFRLSRTRETGVLRAIIEPTLLAEQANLVAAMTLAQRLRATRGRLPSAALACRNFFAAR